MKSIAIVANRRNVGKTTTAINLAIGLGINGKDVILVDADEQAKINFYLGARERNTLDQVLRGEKDIIEAVYLHPSGIRIVPSVVNNYKSYFIDIKKIINELKAKADIVIINAPIDDKNIDWVLEAADEVLIVSEQNNYSIANTNELIKKIKEKGKTILGIVISKATDKGHNYSEQIEIPVVSVIPEDKKMDKAVELNTPVLLFKEKSEAGENYEKLVKLFS